jgi:hypothetical protein
MGSSRITDEMWKRARIQWESEPLASFAHIAVDLGVSKPLVGKVAKKQGWRKLLDMATVSARAHFQADLKFTPMAVDGTSQAPAVDARAAQKWDPSDMPALPSGASMTEARRAAEASVVEKRAEVLSRHRSEAQAVRGLIYGAIKSPDIDVAKKAKIVAEGMKLVQEIERKAWGLDGDDKAKPSVQVIINRKSGMTIGR